MAGHGHHLCGDVLSQTVVKPRRVGMQHLGHADNLRGGLRGSSGLGTGHQHMHIAAAGQGRSHGVEGGAADGRVVVFGDDEDAHFKSPSLRS